MNLFSNKSATTLLELIIAIAILGLIVLGISNLELFSRYQVTNSDRRAQLQHNASYALEHMAKYIGQAIGNVNDMAVKAYDDNKGIRIRIDDNPANGRIDVTDSWIAYRHENIDDPATDSEIRYYPPNAGNSETLPVGPNAYQTLARKILISTPTLYGLEFSGNFDVNGWLRDNVIEVKIITRWDPSQPASSDNPQVEMKNSIKMPSVSTN